MRTLQDCSAPRLPVWTQQWVKTLPLSQNQWNSGRDLGSHVTANRAKRYWTGFTSIDASQSQRERGISETESPHRLSTVVSANSHAIKTKAKTKQSILIRRWNSPVGAAGGKATACRKWGGPVGKAFSRSIGGGRGREGARQTWRETPRGPGERGRRTEEESLPGTACAFQESSYLLSQSALERPTQHLHSAGSSGKAETRRVGGSGGWCHRCLPGGFQYRVTDRSSYLSIYWFIRSEHFHSKVWHVYLWF